MKALYRLFYYTSILLTTLIAILTITGAFAGYASSMDFRLMPFVGLILPGLLLANFALAIYWAIRWRYWVYIPIVALLSNMSYLSSVFQFPLFDAASEPKEKLDTYTPGMLTVATYNVDSFNREESGYSCQQIAAHMRSLKADILCFQEFGINEKFDLAKICVTLSEWPYYYIPISPEGKPLLQLALFSRYPIKEQHLITYPDSKNCSFWCDIEINGRTIRIFNNHLQTTEVTQNKRKLEKELYKDDPRRAEYAVIKLANGLHENFKKRAIQANLVSQLISASPHPVLVCGDFNSLPSSYTYHTMKSGKLQDGFQTAGHGYMYTFRYFKHLLRIDYIFHSPELQTTDYFSPNLEYSDHNPVVMRVKL